MVEQLVGPDLPELPTLGQLDERLNRVVPSCFPVEPGLIDSCRSAYQVENNEKPSGNENEFFFLKASNV